MAKGIIDDRACLVSIAFIEVALYLWKFEFYKNEKSLELSCFSYLWALKPYFVSSHHHLPYYVFKNSPGGLITLPTFHYISWIETFIWHLNFVMKNQVCYELLLQDAWIKMFKLGNFPTKIW